ncbi:MAG: hypothetical protein AABY02_00475, partial [Nanoarchaeota archaeon]
MTKNKMTNELKLEITESLQEDIDKGIARVPSRLMNKLKIVSGDLIEIKAKHTLVLRAVRSLKRDEGRDIIRLDGTSRTNLGASIGDEISVKPTQAKAAQSITLAPLREVQFSADPTDYFHTKLLNIPLM